MKGELVLKALACYSAATFPFNDAKLFLGDQSLPSRYLKLWLVRVMYT